MFTPAFANTSAQPPSLMMQFLPLIIIFGIFYFLLIRPQQKRAKEHREKDFSYQCWRYGYNKWWNKRKS